MVLTWKIAQSLIASCKDAPLGHFLQVASGPILLLLIWVSFALLRYLCLLFWVSLCCDPPSAALLFSGFA